MSTGPINQEIYRVSALPRRIAGANLPEPCLPPKDGWFGAGTWTPTGDRDERTRGAFGVLLGCAPPDDSDRYQQLLQRVSMDSINWTRAPNRVPPPSTPFIRHNQANKKIRYLHRSRNYRTYCTGLMPSM